MYSSVKSYDEDKEMVVYLFVCCRSLETQCFFFTTYFSLEIINKSVSKTSFFFFTESIDAFECIGAMNAWIFFRFKNCVVTRFCGFIHWFIYFVEFEPKVKLKMTLIAALAWSTSWLHSLAAKMTDFRFDGIPCFTVLLKKVQIVNKYAHLFGSFVSSKS